MQKFHKQMKMKKFIRKNRSMSRLVVIDDEELIHQVSMRPALYNRSLKANRKAPIRLQLWQDVSESMDAGVEECRKRWRSLRDSFAKHYKRMHRSLDDSNKQRKWMFYDQMSFLIPYLNSASYELHGILDEIGDNSEDAQSIVCEPILSTDEQALSKELQTNHDERESHNAMDPHDEHINNHEEHINNHDEHNTSNRSEQMQQALEAVQTTDSVVDNNEPIQQATVAVQATDSLGDHNEQTQQTTVAVQATDSRDDHNEQIQQATGAVQATDSMCMQEEPVLVENNVLHYNPLRQNMARSDFSRNPNTTMSILKSTETSNDFGHVMNSEEKFLLSCAPALFRFTNRQKALARLKIQQILYDIEFGQQQND